MTDAVSEAPPAPALLRAVRGLSRGCGVVSALFIRYLLNGSTIWQTEAVVYLVIAATLLGLPYVQLLRGHVNVDLLPMMLPMALRRALAVVVLGVSIAVMAVMFWHGFELWEVALRRGWRSDTVWGVSLWIPYLAMPVGFGAFILQLAADLWAVAAGHEKPFEGGGAH